MPSTHLERMNIVSKIKKVLAIILICTSLISACSIVSYAATQENTVTPRYNNVVSATTSVAISDSGVITITNKYNGINGTTTKGVITTYIEKKTLGLFWTRVDIGTTNDEWVDTINNYKYTGNHTYQLESTGKYRVTVTFVIYGNNGAADEIEKQITKEY